SVGDYALQKVLYDAEGIFGYYPHPPNFTTNSRTNMNRCEWMSKLPDTVPLHQLNIPGTHASTTWFFNNETHLTSPYNSKKANNLPPASLYQCQTSSIIHSLNAGIRFFDLSFSIDTTGKNLVFQHGNALLSETATVETVMFGFYAWLEQHPSEALFISLKYGPYPHEPPLTPQSSIDKLIYTLLTSRPARRFIYQPKTLPYSLGDCRGKIILLRRFDLLLPHFDLPGIHLSPRHYPPCHSKQPFSLTYGGRYDKHQRQLHISDWHDLSSSLSGQPPTSYIKEKLLVVDSHLELASKGYSGEESGGGKQQGTSHDDGPEVVNPDDGELWITFTSGESNLDGVTPEILALGSEDTKDSEGHRFGVNKGLCKLLRTRYRGKRLGVIVVDFWDGEHGDDLVGAILG
ncbi:PLC-like phosphodiesterase, partial [Triangularia setosa]